MMLDKIELIEKCPVCDDNMTYDHCNYYPTWSDDYDNIVCWWCATHSIKGDN